MYHMFDSCWLWYTDTCIARQGLAVSVAGGAEARPDWGAWYHAGSRMQGPVQLDNVSVAVAERAPACSGMSWVGNNHACAASDGSWHIERLLEDFKSIDRSHLLTDPTVNGFWGRAWLRSITCFLEYQDHCLWNRTGAGVEAFKARKPDRPVRPKRARSAPSMYFLV